MAIGRTVRWAALLPAILALTACARLGWFDRGREAEPAEPAAAPAETVGEAAPSVDRDALLRDVIRKHIAENSGDPDRIARSRPYYYREYSVYTDQGESADVSVTETDTRLRPYIATVRIDKQRFATKLHRDIDEARADADFLRDTGTETLNFEWRGNHWEQVGSLFVARTTEQQVNGEWTPVRETEQRIVAAEEDEAQGWLSKFWTGLTGR